jgi:LuxR family transcriptional regulator, maltose regulon positive regulatory protein
MVAVEGSRGTSVAVMSSSVIGVGLPDLGDGDHVLDRRQLSERLAVGTRGALTVVEAPNGSGKTLGVARWSAGPTPATGVVWLDAGRFWHRGQRFWAEVRSGLLALGSGPLPQEPAADAPEAAWNDWITTFTRALDRDGRVWLLVLDDFPAGAAGTVGRQLVEALRWTTNLRVVLTCMTWDADDMPGLRLLGSYMHIGPDSLRFNEQEVAAMLAAHGAAGDSSLVTQVCECTQGWALGVAFAARMLTGDAPVELVLADLCGALDDLLEREVLAGLPAAGRELVVRTSVAPSVPADLSRAVLGLNEPPSTDWVSSAQGFVDLTPDGSFRCHPLLRRCALRSLTRNWPILARASRKVATTWFIEHGDRSLGIELAGQGEDCRLVADALVSSLVVPSIILGASDAGGAELLPEVVAAEPLLPAALAAAAGRTEEAEAALARAAATTDPAASFGESRRLVHRLSEAVIRLAISRQRVDSDAGLRWVAEARRLAAQLIPDQQQLSPELPSLLSAHEGAFRLYAGEFDRAVAALEPTSRVSGQSDAEQVAASECTGLLAWVEALRGNLTTAARGAAAVLTTRPADGQEVGVGYAQLAAAWVHLERRELDQARQRLAHTTRLGEPAGEPWLSAMRRLTEARVVTADGEPDVALRLLSAMRRSTPVAEVGWLGDRISVALAEAHLAAGDPRRALAVLTPEPGRTIVEARVLAAAARRTIGDKRGARGLLTGIEGLVTDAPLPAAVQVWCLSGQLAVDAAENERAAGLVVRALRAAGREELRTALTLVTPWLPAYVERHPDLCRQHRSLVASLGRQPAGFSGGLGSGVGTAAQRGVTPAAMPGLVLEPLTERELQVLERLGQLSTTGEIAGDLFVSANTVKTHIKSLFLKLAVNRRADAVRRGRELGLC